MDVNALRGVVMAACSADNAQRREAEHALGALRDKPGYVVALLQLASPAEADPHVRLMSAIVLKNAAFHTWEHNPERNFNISEEDKEQVRRHVMAVYRGQSGALRSALASLVANIARFDYPTKWPTLVSEALQDVRNTADPNSMYNGLFVLGRIVRTMRELSSRYREPMAQLVQEAFPTLLELLCALESANTEAAAEMMKIIVKMYYSANMHNTSAYVRQPGPLRDWWAAFKRLLDKELPEDAEGREPRGMPTDRDERSQWVWWKLKKWLLTASDRFFSHHGIPSRIKKSDREGIAAAQYWLTHVAPGILASVMNLLGQYVAGKETPDKVLCQALMFLCEAVGAKPLFAHIQPHLDFVIFQLLFKALTFNDADQELWEEDQEEYLRRMKDPVGDFHNPKTAAANVVTRLLGKPKVPVLDRIMAFARDKLMEYAHAAPNARDPRLKDGVLAMITCCSLNLTESKTYKPALEGMIMEHVVPEFDSPYPFLRVRACSVICYFVEIDFQHPHNVQTIVKKALNALQDPELAVQIEAAGTIQRLFQSEEMKEIACQVAHPVLGDVIRQYVAMMQRIGIDECVGSLHEMVMAYGNAIIPHAEQLVGELLQTFRMYHAQMLQQDSDDENLEMAAAACLDVLVTLLSVVREEPAIMQRLGQQSLPLAVAIFDPEQQLLEFFDTGITLLEWLVFGMPELGPQFWDAYCALIDCYHRFAIDYAPNMVVVVDHYMARATDVMVTQGRNGQSYVDMALGMLPKALNKGWSTEAGAACMITQSTFFHCRGRVDDKVPGTLSVLMNGLADAHTKVQALHPETGAEEGTPSITDVEVLRVRLVQTVAALLYYNAELTLATLAQGGEGAVRLWMETTVQSLPAHTMMIDKKITALGLTAVLAVPPERLPPPLRENMHVVFVKDLELLSNLQGQIATAEATAKVMAEGRAMGGEGMDGDDTDWPAGMDGEGGPGGLVSGAGDDDDDDDFDEDEELTFLAGEAAMFMGDMDDDEEFDSPFSEVDELTTFADTLQAASARAPEMWSALQRSLVPAVRKCCDGLLQKAAQKKQEAAQSGQAQAPSA